MTKFKKGNIPWNTGKETARKLKLKISEGLKSFYKTKNGKNVKEKMRKLAKQRKFSKETRLKMSRSGKGRKHSEKTKREMSRLHKGNKNPAWKGGRKKTLRGYILVYCPNHPFKVGGNYILEHRLIMETHIGRVLLPTEVVHHINGIKDDNRIENLMLFSSHSEHRKYEGG